MSRLLCAMALFSMLLTAAGAAIEIPVSPLMADNRLPSAPGKCQWDFREPVHPSKVTLAGRSYSWGDFPVFTILDSDGKQQVIQRDDACWQVQMGMTPDGERQVLYTANGLRVRLAYSADADRLHVVATVLDEGDWKLVSVGGMMLAPVPWTEGSRQYLVDGSGWLVKPGIPKALSRKWDANSDNHIGGFTTAGFASLCDGDAIVTVKPLTFSHWLGWSATPVTKAYRLGGGLYFRPPGVINPTTKLCHDSLAIRLETCGDVNRDGEVDWVDAGVAYRQRYIKPHPKTGYHERVRDAFRVYHQVQTYQSMTGATAGLEKVDFADGIWWCKGMMTFADEKNSESHPYAVERRPGFDDVVQVKPQMDKLGQWMGIYYGHDYISLVKGDWPDELIKQNPQGEPHKYGPHLHYKDNVRGLATGLLLKHYDRIIEACHLRPGDPVMLDTYTAFARPGYHPDYPATAELETQAKHTIAEYLHDKGLIVTGEGIIEGAQDIVDYGAYATPAWNLLKFTQERAAEGVTLVPMLPTVFQGASYYGSGWYEFRNPGPNWAAGLTYGVGYWDWNAQGLQYVWPRYARYYFNQNLPWSKVADAHVTDVKMDGLRYDISYSNGARLETDVEANRWVLTLDGVRYDGFTPFNPRGYMAVLRQDKFDITIPGEHRLEISPNQPFRDKITFECTTGNGQTRLQGKFGHLKWDIPWLTNNAEGKEVVLPREADPVLVLRKVN